MNTELGCSTIESLLDDLSEADNKAGVRYSVSQDNYKIKKYNLISVKKKLYLLQALREEQSPQKKEGLKAVAKKIRDVKQETQDVHEKLAEQFVLLEKALNELETTGSSDLEQDVLSMRSEVRAKCAELGVEALSGGDDQWDSASQGLFISYELDLVKKRIAELQEQKREQEARTIQLENKLAQVQQQVLSKQQQSQAADSTTSWYKDVLDIIGGLSGIKDVEVEDEHTVKITYRNPEHCAVGRTTLQLNIHIRKDAYCYHGLILINDAQCNVTELDISDIVEEAIERCDLRYLVLQVKNRWLAYQPLQHEIASIQERYPVDWLMCERKLRVLCGAEAKVVCTLKVTEDYPRQGSVALIQVEGSYHTPAHPVQPPHSNKLAAWVDFLHKSFSDQ